LKELEDVEGTGGQRTLAVHEREQKILAGANRESRSSWLAFCSCWRRVRPSRRLFTRCSKSEARTRGQHSCISAFYHDSAACLVVDGEIVAAAQEERFTRVKHDHNFPVNAARYCLSEASLSAENLDYVGFYDKPLLKFDRLLEPISITRRRL